MHAFFEIQIFDKTKIVETWLAQVISLHSIMGCWMTSNACQNDDDDTFMDRLSFWLDKKVSIWQVFLTTVNQTNFPERRFGNLGNWKQNHICGIEFTTQHTTWHSLNLPKDSARNSAFQHRNIRHGWWPALPFQCAEVNYRGATSEHLHCEQHPQDGASGQHWWFAFLQDFSNTNPNLSAPF